MNILTVNWLDRDNPQAGGAEIHFFEIFKRLVAGGDSVTLVCSGWKDAHKQTVIDGINVHRVGSRHSFAALGRRVVRERLAAESYDIVVEDINKLPLYIPTLTRLPTYVIIPHLFGVSAFREASVPVASIVWLAERPLAWVYRRSAFQAISESTRDELVDRGVSREQIRVIYPGVDSNWFTPNSSVARAPAPTFLYVGRLKRYKGVETILQAIRILRMDFPDLAMQIAGDGDDQPRLERLVRDWDLGGSVRFLGYVNEEKKRDLLRRAWAHVFPSVKEGWGISNVEAAACGTPAIASDSPGLRESVIHEQTGIVVPHGDEKALAAAMARVVQDPDSRERFGRAARDFALGLSWDTAADLTREHIKETRDR